VYKKQMRWVLRSFGSLYEYLAGMAVEVAATLVLMGVGLLISILGFYLLK
jgi:hypothetical protein